MMIALFIIIYVVVILIHAPGLMKEKQWRELMAFLFFVLTALVLSILFALEVKIPSPYESIHRVLDWLGLRFEG